MTLRDLVNETEEEKQEYSTDKDPEGISLPEESWCRFLIQEVDNPGFVLDVFSSTGEEDQKAILQVLQKELDNDEPFGYKLAPSRMKELEDQLIELIEGGYDW